MENTSEKQPNKFIEGKSSQKKKRVKHDEKKIIIVVSKLWTKQTSHFDLFRLLRQDMYANKNKYIIKFTKKANEEE